MPGKGKIGNLIAVYSGIVTNSRVDKHYVMTLWPGGPSVQGLCDNSSILNKSCRINDPLGPKELTNCTVLHGGLVYQTRDLKKGEELFFTYGSAYDWDDMKAQYYTTLRERILEAAAHLGRDLTMELPPSATALDLAAWRRTKVTLRLLADFLDHDEHLTSETRFPLLYWPDEDVA
jgi:hypothetical protein